MCREFIPDYIRDSIQFVKDIDAIRTHNYTPPTGCPPVSTNDFPFSLDVDSGSARQGNAKNRNSALAVQALLRTALHALRNMVAGMMPAATAL